MLIALPNCQGRISPVLDVASRLLLIRLEAAEILERREVVIFEKSAKGIVRSMRELRVELLICGAVSYELQHGLEQAGICVLAGVCGELESVLAAYLSGNLGSREFVMPGCCASPCAWHQPTGPRTTRKRRSLTATHGTEQ